MFAQKESQKESQINETRKATKLSNPTRCEIIPEETLYYENGVFQGKRNLLCRAQ